MYFTLVTMHLMPNYVQDYHKMMHKHSSKQLILLRKSAISHKIERTAEDIIQSTNKFKSNYMLIIRFTASVVVPCSSCRYTLQPLKLELIFKIEIKMVIQMIKSIHKHLSGALQKQYSSLLPKLYWTSIRVHTCFLLLVTKSIFEWNVL